MVAPAQHTNLEQSDIEQLAKHLRAMVEWMPLVAFIDRWRIADCILQFTPSRHGDAPQLMLASIADIEKRFAGSGKTMSVYRSLSTTTFADLVIDGFEVTANEPSSTRQLGEFVL